MPSQNVLTFGFRRGTKNGLINAPVLNGSLNFTTDTEEMYVDIDDRRLTISSVEFYETEDEIKSITNPGEKLYVANNTKRILAYSAEQSEWIYVSSSSGGVFYGTCSTEGSEQIKLVEISAIQNFELKVGVVVAVKFDNTNTFVATEEEPVQINFNDTGAANIYYGNSNNPLGNNVIAFGEGGFINQYMYDGEYWIWMGRSNDDDTKYSLATTEHEGLMPQLLDGAGEKYLRADGTWATPYDPTVLHVWIGTYNEYESMEHEPGIVYFITDADVQNVPVFFYEEMSSTEYNNLPVKQLDTTYFITDDGPVNDAMGQYIAELQNKIDELTARIEALENS